MLKQGRQDIYYAKIMLFGEYGVICNSMALTIPYAHFKGEMGFINDEKYTEYEFAVDSNKSLKSFSSYLRDIQDKGKLEVKFDIDRFDRDIGDGLYFESSIPQGYGIGSSGALCAAVYNEYSINGIQQKRFLTTDDIVSLKSVFSQMESYFHGVSSGLDPLLCFIKYPLLIKDKEHIQTVGIPRNRFNNNGAIFLINTGRIGKTGPLVNTFFKSCENSEFKKMIDEVFIPTNDNCINALLNGEMSSFFANLYRLSQFQHEHFKPMIPAGFEEVWKEGLNNGLYNLKLCGSGGGGFLLGITENYPLAKKYLEERGVEPILVYIKS
jgi:mevalonate kinase